ncbi:MAG: glucosaminidase domain-containing protein [Saprospiraceae bacterium]|nr:glucosaminidase domain-containing protein [Saprospiraceae bacterium]
MMTKQIFPVLLLVAAFSAPSCSAFKKKPEPAPASSMFSSRTGADRNQIYTEKFASAAIYEMQRLGVPASITLAQGILESGAGTSELAQNANNHFGIKCGNDWKGATYMKKDDDRGPDGKLKESCFRKYTKVEESYIDHGHFLRDPKKEFRYGFLFKLDPTDYKGWAQGLQAAGYSTSNTYADKLIDIIERYKLYEYDVASGKPTAPPQPENPQYGTETGADVALPNPANRVGRINNVKVAIARQGETINDIARTYMLKPDKVAEYNDRGYTPLEKLKANTRIFIEPKKDKWTSGPANEHVVKADQTMFDISQVYGIKLSKLLERNYMTRGQEPAEGERIRLNSNRSKSDPVRLRDGMATTKPENPGGYWPTPNPGSMTPDEDGLLEEIGGGEGNKPQQPSTPPTTTPPTTPPPSAPAPVVTGSTNYPPIATPPSTPPPSPTNPAAPGTHVVAKGDTLFSIARKYNTTVANIKRLNNMTSDTVKIGETLRVQ